jgi:hypothetical protein
MVLTAWASIQHTLQREVENVLTRRRQWCIYFAESAYALDLFFSAQRFFEKYFERFFST